MGGFSFGGPEIKNPDYVGEYRKTCTFGGECDSIWGMPPTLQQTQFLKRYIALDELPVPENGQFANMTINSAWLRVVRETDAELLLQITQAGRKAFWDGVRVFGRKAVMGQFALADGPQGAA